MTDIGSTKAPGRFEKFLLSIMGPAQIGDLNAPSTLVPSAERDLCRKCGQPWSLHQVIRPSTLTLAICPAADTTAGPAAGSAVGMA